MVDKIQKPRKWGVLILFATMPTMICCVLPIVLVSAGLGSVVASLYGEHFTFLQWFGLNKNITFGVTALILAGAAWAIYRPGRMCPTDPALAAACNAADKWNKRFFKIAVAMWALGVFTVYILPYLPIFD